VNEQHEYSLELLNAPRTKTLHQATCEELYDEIRRKSRASVIVWIERSTDDQGDVYNANKGGSWAEATGLLIYLKSWIKSLRPRSMR